MNPTPLTPLISVITPAFNAAKTIVRAYDSLLSQTFRDWEYIVVDDGSGDGTEGMVRQFHDARVRKLTRIANSGTGAALNAGARQATGRYLAFLDADDEFLPTHLAEHVEIMERDAGIDLMWGGVELVIKDESQAWIPDLVRGLGLIHVSECVVQGTIFVRRAVFDAVAYSEDRSIWYQDFDFVQRVRAANYRVERFHSPTYRYYRNSGSSQIDRAKATWSGS